MMKPHGERGWCSRVLWGAVFFLLVICPSRGAGAAEKPGGPIPNQNMIKTGSPLHIASDRMEASQKDRTILFEGHVVVQQDDLTITGNRLKVFAMAADKADKKDPKAAKDPQGNLADKIDRIEVEGSVKITQRDKVASADKAVYYHQDQKIVLMGHPEVSQGRDTVQGRLITLYLADERSVVEGGESTPVQAVLHPARKEKE